MYLSRVEIDILNRRKLRDLTSLDAYHGWVETSFPEEIEKGVRKRHLWRVDKLSGKEYLLVVSEDKPSISNLEKYGVEGTGVIKHYDEFLNRINVGQIMKFRLTANPTMSKPTPGAKRGKIYPHITKEQQENWLLQRADNNGFEFDIEDGIGFSVVNRDWPIVRKNGRRIKLSRVSYEGYLRVTDVELFKKSLITGIGREKAYGMGMLTVIPVVN